MTNYTQKVISTDNNIQTIQVSLKNRGNQLLDLHGAEWVMILKLEY